jgi:hypothetical protein
VRRLRVRKTARAEIVAAFEWYLERSPIAAERFLEAVDEEVIGLCAWQDHDSFMHPSRP